MKICFLEGDMSRRGGTERMTAMLANALQGTHEIWIISLQLKGEECFFELNKEVHHIVLPKYKGRLTILKQMKYIHHLIKKENIDWIINVDVGMGFYGILAAKGTKTKVITWEHGNYYNNWGSRIFPYLRKVAAKHSDAMVVLTERDKQNYQSNIKMNAPIYVIANPMKKHDFTYDINSRVILSAGLLLPIKGFDKAIQVAAKVLPKYPEWKWIICGEGPERSKLELMIRKFHLEDQMLLVGSVQDMDREYQRAAMYVMTSEMEGLPMVLLEAKSWGLPIVSFDIMTGPSDIIRNGINGYLVEPYDIDDMADKIEDLVRHQELRQSFSNYSQLDVDRFDFENILGKWEQIMEDKRETIN